MTQRDTFLPFARPDFDGDEYRQIQEALEAGWITSGPKTRQFGPRKGKESHGAAESHRKSRSRWENSSGLWSIW